jgi:Fic family protein
MIYQPPFGISDEIVDLLAKISHKLGKLDYLQHHPQAVELRKISQIKTITGTLQIEGNMLTEKQVTAVLEGKTVLAPMREISEAQGAILLYQQAENFDYKNQAHLLQAHRLLMGDLLNRAGQYRNQAVGVYGAEGVSHIAPPAHRVSGLMSDLFVWLKETTTHPLISSSVFHYEFEFIHPFEDGNGRMGRFWQYLMLNHWNPVFSLIPVENMIKSRQQEYYQALQQAGKAGDSTVFIVFMCQVILEAISLLQRYSDQADDQVSDQVKRLLTVLPDHWLSATEMMELLGLSHKPTFRKNYL